MITLAAALIAIAAAVLVLRHWLLHRRAPRRHTEAFDGQVYAVGQAAISERRCEQPRSTVIAMHGFLEDVRYFTGHYADPDVQLILLTSADYHVPFGAPPYPAPEWASTPSAPEGSIRYDAEVLVQALEHLPRTDSIRVHGHSRGGAVVLEAAALRPDLFADVEVVLEAPVLPGGRVYAELSPALLWFFPLVLELWRALPMPGAVRRAYGSLESARKRHLLESLPFHPRTARVALENLRGIGRWMRERDPSLYAHVRRGVVLVPGKDKILRRLDMLESARAAGERLQLIELEGCSHFVLLDRPDAVPGLRRARQVA